MSLGGTLSDQHTLSSSLIQKGGSRVELNLFQKLDILATELEGVEGKLIRLG